jgi:hypothetical protein
MWLQKPTIARSLNPIRAADAASLVGEHLLPPFVAHMFDHRVAEYSIERMVRKHISDISNISLDDLETATVHRESACRRPIGFVRQIYECHAEIMIQ